MKSIYKIVLLLVSATGLLFSQNEFGGGVSNAGTEFWFTVPPGLEDIDDDRNNVYVMVASSVKTKATIDLPGKGYNKTIDVLPGELSTFMLTPQQAQAYTKSGHDPVVESNVIGNTGIKLIAEAPVIVYVIVKYGNFSEGFSPLPVSSLGTKYKIASYGDGSQLYPFYNSFPSLTAIVAAYDNTIVNFTLPANSTSKVAGGFQPGEKIERHMNRGDVWVISSREKASDLSGSIVDANHPVSVISGNQSANVPLFNKWNNYIAETEIPTKAFGKTYHVPLVHNRKYSPVIRIFAKDNNTEVFADGKSIGTINDNKFYIDYRFNKDAEASIGVISSDKAIRVVLYNTGIEEENNPSVNGSTFQMNLLPVEQYSNELIFGIPSSSLNYEENYIAVIHEGNKISDQCEYIDLKSPGNPEKLNSLFAVQNKQFSQSINGKIYSQTILLLPKAGVFKIQSDTKLAAYLYGFNNSLSYGMPAATIVNDLESEDYMAPVPSWVQSCDGSVDGFTVDKPDNTEHRSNLRPPLIESIANYNRYFDEIIPGISSSFSWSLKVAQTELPASASITFRDMAGNDSTIYISYTPPEFELSPARHNLGNISIGEEGTFKISLLNTGNIPINISKLFLSKGTDPFEIDNAPYNPFVLEANDSKEISIAYNALTNGVFTDTLIAEDDCGIRSKSILEVRIDAADIEVTDINFGKQVINTSTEYNAKIVNKSSVTLIVKAFQGPQSSAFAVRELDISASDPLEIPAGESHEFFVKFTPTVNKNYSDKITFISNADGQKGISDNVCLINAIGIEPGLSANSLNWNRKRINRQDHPAGPYPAENNEGIILSNKGDVAITVQGIDVILDRGDDYFNFNKQLFTNLKLQPDSSFSVAASFRPSNPGIHRITINYIDDNLGNATTILEGIGVVPKVKSTIVDFDTSVVGSINSPKRSVLRISNQGYSEWEFADTLNIYDIRSAVGSEIAFSDSEFGSKGFRVLRDGISYPLSLAPGNYVDIPVEFAAQYSGEHNAELLVISDAINENADFRLKGYGINNEIEIIDGYGEVCVGEKTKISAHISNKGSKAVNIANVKFGKDMAEFNFEDPSITDGFELLPNQQKELAVIFSPSQKITESLNIILTEVDQSNIYSAEITGRTILIKRDLSITPLNKSVEIEEEIQNKLYIEKGSEIEHLNVQNIILTLNFDGSVLQPIKNSFVIGKDYAGKFKVSKVHQNNPGEYEIGISTIGGEAIAGSGELLVWHYNTYLPQSFATSSDIKLSAESPDTDCLVFNPASAEIKLLPVCADSLRRIEIGKDNFKLGDVKYENSKITFDYTNGFASDVQAEIINPLGKIVVEKTDLDNTSGEHIAEIDTDLPSGVYFLKFKSGPYSDVRKFLITK